MVENPNLSAKDLSNIIGISQRKIEENISKLKKKDLIKRIGSPKGGHWEIIDKQYIGKKIIKKAWKFPW